MRDGTYVRSGSVAADLSMHPLGTTLYIEGLGEFVVRDSGGGVHGLHLDVWFASCEDAINWGRRTRSVWIQ